MNTYSEKFSRLIREHPAREESLRRLESALQLSSSGRAMEFPIGKIVDIVSPVTPPDLAALLEALVRAGIFERILRVESPANGGIKDFASLVDIPDVIHDDRTDSQLEVTPDRIRVIYRAH